MLREQSCGGSGGLQNSEGELLAEGGKMVDLLRDSSPPPPLPGRVRRKKKALPLPGGAVVLRVPPPLPPLYPCCCYGAADANCAACHIGQSADKGILALPEETSSPLPMLEKKPNNLFIANNLAGGEVVADTSPPMISKVWRAATRRPNRKRALVCLVGAACFAVGLALPVIFKQLFFSPGDRDLDSDYGRFRPPANVFGRISVGDYNALDYDVLRDLFISVKTTRRNHNPRLVIQLETWASLVKDQVRIRCPYLKLSGCMQTVKECSTSNPDLVLHRRRRRGDLPSGGHRSLHRHRLPRVSRADRALLQDGQRV